MRHDIRPVSSAVIAHPAGEILEQVMLVTGVDRPSVPAAGHAGVRVLLAAPQIHRGRLNRTVPSVPNAVNIF